MTAIIDITLYKYPVEIQDLVRDWIEAEKRIREQGRPALLEWTVRTGLSQSNIYRRLAEWRDTGQWSVFIDRRKWPEFWDQDRQVELPAEFLRWVGGQMLGNQRKNYPAWRAIIRQWKRWRAGQIEARIPGYDTCPPPGHTGRYPAGWSYSNLMRKAAPPKAELAISRVGTSAAKEHLPYVPGTRAGARWMEFIFFDDVHLDREVIVPGYWKPVRVLQFGGLDYSSAYYLKFGQRPDLPGDDGHRDRLTRRDFLHLVAALFDEFGFPCEYPCHLILERGTATLSSAEAQLLYELSDGRIRCGYTTMNGQFLFAWDEDRSGNYTGKSPLESWHNLYHNEQAAYNGQVGKDRQHCPAQLQGQEREVVALAKATALLPEARRDQIVPPFATLEQCYWQSYEIVSRINNREEHDCEGFDRVPMWRMPAVSLDWRPVEALSALDPAQQRFIEWTTRVETPEERRAKLSRGMRMMRLPPQVWVRFYEDSHALAKIERSSITIRVAGRSLIFGPMDPADALPDGTEVMAHFNPTDPKKVFATHQGRFVAEWPRWNRVARGDTQELQTAIRRKQSYLNAAVASTRGKRAEYLESEERRMQANLTNLAQAGLLSADACQNLGMQTTRTTAADTLQTISQAIEDNHRAAREAQREIDRISRAAAEELLTPGVNEITPGVSEKSVPEDESFLADIT